ncbi:TetR/AcrR family transcriptional regulator [Roseovarius atlanticus]|nr:TetR/AcrR family transcriptional regulator [Roseovarius atlanticus]MBY6148238.1 TetR/AcrR family transcriptional regulator [Roseovarius atlanticus]
MMARGRPRKCDPEDVFDKALTLFWKKGYAATSMNDLVVETGMAKPGLYANFGSKDDLFTKALRHYFDRFLSTLGKEFAEADAPIDVALRTLLLGIVRASKGDTLCVGCFLLNTVVETTGTPSELRDLSREMGERRRKMLRDRLRRAVLAGELRQEANVEDLAQFISGQMLAIAAMASEGADRPTLERFAENALAVLPLARAA